MNEHGELIRWLRFLARGKAGAVGSTADVAAEAMAADAIEALMAERDRLLSEELAAVQKDAKRYRFIRRMTWGERLHEGGLLATEHDDSLDAAIDAAMQEKERRDE